MHIRGWRFGTTVLMVFGLSISLAGPLQAAVDLEWRPEYQTAGFEETVGISLYAVSDDETDQGFSIVEAVLVWDPSLLALMGHTDDGPYAWSYSGFFNDSNRDALNTPCEGPATCVPDNDGNAWYAAYPAFGEPPPLATPEGLLITTFNFQVVNPGAFGRLELVPEYRHYSYTGIQHPDTPGAFVTGNLGPGAVVHTGVVPTVSEWGLGIAALLFLGAGTYVTRRRAMSRIRSQVRSSSSTLEIGT